MEGLERVLIESAFFKDMKKQHLLVLAGCASNVVRAVDSIAGAGPKAPTASVDGLYKIRLGREKVELAGQPAQKIHQPNASC